MIRSDTQRIGVGTARLRVAAGKQAEAWIKRLEALPAYYDVQIANMRRGIAQHYVLDCVSLPLKYRCKRQ